MRSILEKLKQGEISIEDAERALRAKMLNVGDVAVIDLEREHRTGIPEVIIAEGKDGEHLRQIIREYLANTGRVIVSRLDRADIDPLRELGYNFEYYDLARICVLTQPHWETETAGGSVGIITAGTSDIPAAEEARVIAEQLGCKVLTAYDVGIAGVHRLFPVLDRMLKEGVDVYIVAAGREGALPTLVSGIVDGPVIGLPISTGYGIASNGKAALYAMLQSCAPLVVVNIDAGFVAGAVAAQIANKIDKARRSTKNPTNNDDG